MESQCVSHSAPICIDSFLTSRMNQDNFALDKIFRDHDDFVSCLAWSPDDSILLTAAESTIKMWNTSVSTVLFLRWRDMRSLMLVLNRLDPALRPLANTSIR